MAGQLSGTKLLDPLHGRKLLREELQSALAGANIDICVNFPHHTSTAQRGKIYYDVLKVAMAQCHQYQGALLMVCRDQLRGSNQAFKDDHPLAPF